MCSSGRVQLVCVQWTQCQTHSRLREEAGTDCTYDLGEHYPPLFVWVNTEAPCKFISITAKLSCTYLFASHWVCQSMSTSNTHWKDTQIACLLCLSPYFWHSILVPKPARPHLYICTHSNQNYCIITLFKLLFSSKAINRAQNGSSFTNAPIRQSDLLLKKKKAWLWSLIHVIEAWLFTSKTIWQI